MKSKNHFITNYCILYILLKTLAFHPAEHIWALEPGFQCEREKKREFALFPFALGAFAFYSALFSSRFRSLFLLRARERESAKKAPSPSSSKM
jgi:hypothetical protein